MNTKKLFMLLAAVLLGTVSAFAQSGNNNPLKGDVNGDGVVDVADIAAVIAIIKNNAAPVQATYYQGTATETQIQNQSYINGLSYNQPTKPTSTVDVQQGYNLFIFPSSWGTPTLYEDSAHTFRWTPYTASDLGITNPSGKQVLVWKANSNRTVYIVW